MTQCSSQNRSELQPVSGLRRFLDDRTWVCARNVPQGFTLKKLRDGTRLGTSDRDVFHATGAASWGTCCSSACGTSFRSNLVRVERRRGAPSRATRPRGGRRSRRFGQTGGQDEADVHVQEMQHEDQQADIETGVRQRGGDSKMRRLQEQSPDCR